MTSACEAVKKLESSDITAGSVKWCSCCGKQFGSSSKG